ncbi:MAG: hypothetical protein H7A23_24805 [Leptospiraceae bacterium]|nr:hypothetical protein [Leptospiraceae bacterium]MCP5497786.1 hypothetical protein [Leptospiraceae bacterium]
MASNSGKDTTSFSFLTSLQTTFTGTNISVTVPYNTNLTVLVATFTTTGTSAKIGTTT